MGRLKKFVIMLDGELDNSRDLGQWPIRGDSDNMDDLVGIGFGGNPHNVPRSEAIIDEHRPLKMTELIHNVTQTLHRGSIYRVLG